MNTWGRVPFARPVGGGPAEARAEVVSHGFAMRPAASRITRNMIICNWECTWPLDHDDGSQEYHDSFNFLLYGGAKNYMGRNKASTDNVYIDPDGKPSEGAWSAEGMSGPAGGQACANNDGSRAVGHNATGGASGYNETFARNRCVMWSSNHTIYAFGQTGDGTSGPRGSSANETCVAKIFDFTANNSFYAPDAQLTVQCTRLETQGGNARYTLAEWQALAPANDGEGPKVRRDVGSTVSARPSAQAMIGWGKALLAGGAKAPPGR